MGDDVLSEVSQADSARRASDAEETATAETSASPSSDVGSGRAVVASASPSPLIARVRVRTYELDSFGHVNNATYLQYAEEARSEYLKQLGVSFNDFARLGVHLVIVEAHLRFLQAARYGDDIEIRGRIFDVRTASIRLEYELTETNRNVKLAEITTRGAFVNAVTGKPTRAPSHFLDALARIPTDRSL